MVFRIITLQEGIKSHPNRSLFSESICSKGRVLTVFFGSLELAVTPHLIPRCQSYGYRDPFLPYSK